MATHWKSMQTSASNLTPPPALLPPQLPQSSMNLLSSVSNYGSNTATSPMPFQRRTMQQDMVDRETQARALAAAGNSTPFYFILTRNHNISPY